ncbi:MAG TPA: hypothetical protein VN625_09615, partial [Desulfuromonadaceae bacterium]|nr:hypothetical protein [Desulfuromonadaceae bacterium]
MNSRMKWTVLGVVLVSINLVSAQEEQVNRNAGASDRYWTAPRIQSDPPVEVPGNPSSITTNLVIENDILRVTWTGSALNIANKTSGTTFLDGSFNIAGGVGKSAAYNHKMLGPGQGIEITNPDGSVDRVMLFPHLPFVLLRTVLIDGGTNSWVVKTVRPFQGRVHLASPASRLKVLGSAGLTGPEKNPGSYNWLTVADPQTRNGVVFGWLTSEHGCGVLFDKVEGDAVRVGAQIDFGRLTVGAGKTNYLETLAIGYFDDARIGLETFAGTIAREQDIALPPQPTVYCTWYSQPYGQAADEQHFAENTAFAETNLGPFGFSVAQIDDHWQSGVSTNGPKRGFLEAAPSGPYPHGMKATADAVKAMGVKPGLWFLPFTGTYYDPIFSDHQDWFVHHTDGR